MSDMVGSFFFLNLDLITFRIVKSIIMQNDAGEFVDLYVPRKWWVWASDVGLNEGDLQRGWWFVFFLF